MQSRVAERAEQRQVRQERLCRFYRLNHEAAGLLVRDLQAAGVWNQAAHHSARESLNIGILSLLWLHRGQVSGDATAGHTPALSPSHPLRSRGTGSAQAKIDGPYPQKKTEWSSREDHSERVEFDCTAYGASASRLSIREW